MPYKSDKQRRYMHAKHPEIAARWDAEIRAKKKVSKGNEQNWKMGKPLEKQGYEVKDKKALGRLQSAANRGYRGEQKNKKALKRIGTGAAVGAGSGLVIAGPRAVLGGAAAGSLGGLGYHLHRGFKSQSEGFRNQLGSELEGGRITYRKPVKKAFENHPKVKMQAFSITNTDDKGRMSLYQPTHASTHPRGKTLILRRPKYQVVGQPDKRLQKVKGKKGLGQLTPNRTLKHEDALTFANAYKNKAKKVTTSTGYQFTHEVGKRAVISKLQDKNLSRAKRASASLSIAGGTMGLGGLAALAMKKKPLATNLSIGATGVGGIGSYNYAAIQRAEAKKKAPTRNVYVVRNKRQIKSIKSGLEPVTKGLTTMDFGLNDVRQGESVISKRQVTTSQQRKRGDQGANVGQLAGPAVGYFGAAAHKGGKMGYGLSRSLGSNPIPSLATGARTAPAAIKGAAKPGAMLNTAMKHPFMAAGTMIGGAVAGQKIGQMSAKPKAPQPMAPKPMKPIGPKKPKQTFGKSSDWMNISEHQRRSRDSRRTSHRGENVAGIGGAIISGTAGHYAGNQSSVARSRNIYKYPNMDKQITTLRDASIKSRHRYAVSRMIGGSRENSLKYAAGPLKAGIKAAPHAAAGTAGAAVMAGGLAVAGAAKANEKRHDRAVARLRRQRVGKELVFKAYNPEEKRLRRTEHSATALSVGSGAAAAGSFQFGRKAVGAKGTGMKGLRAKSLPHFKTGLKNAGKAGGLGVTAVGLAVASDRVRNYRHGRGSTYRALHR